MKTKIYIGILAITMAFAGCTKDFEDTNINPNQPTPDVVDPALLLTYIQKHGGLGNADLHQRFHNIMVDTWAQYMIDLPNNWATDNNALAVELPWINQYWREFYGWINSANIIINTYKDDPAKNNLVQITRIWKVHLYAQASDFFGDMPYFKAADGSGIIPEYDSQDLIYKDFLKELKEAVAALDETAEKGSLSTQDIIFKGDPAKWKKYGNSLRLRYAIRISKAEPELAKTNAEEAVKAGVLSEDDSDVGVPPMSLRWGDMYPIPMYVGWWETAMSDGFYNILANLGGISNTAYHEGAGDPRGTVYFTTLADGFLKGIKMGLNSANATLDENQPHNNSRPNTVTLTPEKNLVVMPVSEVLFLQAEGALKGWDMGGTAASFYQKGVTYSMNQWGVDAALVPTYLASTEVNNTGVSVAFDDVTGGHNTQLEKIITQKYIAGWPDNGFEAWADHRRLLMPYLQPAEYSDPSFGVKQYVSGEPTYANYIERILYPPSESINDAAMYEKVKAKDKVTTPLWWTGR